MARAQELESYQDETRPYAPVPVVVHEAPEWLAFVPPHTAFLPGVQRWWSYIMRWLRLPALAWLWVTAYWYRFALTVLSAVSLVLVYLTR